MKTEHFTPAFPTSATIRITTQEELDALPMAFDTPTRIDIIPPPNTTIEVLHAYKNAVVFAGGNTKVAIHRDAWVIAEGKAEVSASGSLTLLACDIGVSARSCLYYTKENSARNSVQYGKLIPTEGDEAVPVLPEHCVAPARHNA